jgi:hypothetical protein
MMHDDRHNGHHDSGEIYSKAVKAGKRTYFFDVKSTRGNDYYLTITESKKRFDDSGNFSYEKHKLFLYKEDFDKFAEGLEEIINFIRSRSDYQPPQHFENHYYNADNNYNGNNGYSSQAPVAANDVTFEDLNNNNHQS